ncbi:PKD-like domain-containing protein [Mucilaginibacter sp. McL0603]|uniref:PKD-like domain-containing protein n=1 Tax=Mucilaginibacter sp. McL0603 TaxID=3415670 RepID=UPI003CF2D172
MTKTYTKRLFLLAVFTLFILADTFAQTITVGTVDPGPYGWQSSIAVPINVNVTGGCITQANTFTLYLSDASGNFSPGTAIGTYSGFYAGFVNGVIPTGIAAGTGYRVEVKSSSPAVTSTVSAAFKISAVGGVTASLSSTETVAPNVFGRCVGTLSPYTILSASSGTTASFHNETTGGNEGTNVAIPITGYQFTPTKSNYTITAKSVNGSGIVGTYDYQLINNNLLNPFSPVGQPFTCLPTGGKATLTFGMSFTGAIGINNNYPGTLYTVTWGDGTTSVFTYCDILQANGLLSHDYTAPTCGSATPLQVVCQPSTPYCTNITAPSTTTAKVIITPTVDFGLPAVGCVGTAITVPNNSKPGPDYSTATQTNCNLQNPNALYDWYFDGVKVLSGVKLGVSFTIPATTAHGTHTILLHADAPVDPNTPYCSAPDAIKTICLENPPTPAFTIPSPVCITSMPVTVTNTSTVDNTCSTPAYTWSAIPNTFTFSGGTNKNSFQPQFNFTAAGTYTVTLSIASSCGAKTTQKTIVVQPAPTAVLSANVSFCGKNQTLTFDATAGSSTKTTLNGIPATDTYAWTVTPAAGGATYSFAGGTSASSQYPQITFTAYDTYTVKVTHTNSCGTVFATQQLTFIQPPLVSAGPPQTVCASPAPTVTLAGVVSGTILSHVWSSAGGGTFSSITALNPTYQPSTAEITAGSATLTLTVTSTSPCNTITSQVVITITPIAKITSLPTAPICSGTPLNYTITANLPGTTFAWTSVLTSGTATGFTASGSGNKINDVLINTTTSDAVVTYTILPTYNSCPGIPFMLRVTVHPLPVITATAPSPVCSGVAGNGTVTLSSNVAGTTYTWTSTASAGITGNTNQVTPLLTSSINNTLVNSALTAGTVTYTITPYNGTCPGTPATVNIIVEPTPKTPSAGSDAEICASTTYTLNGNSPTPGTGLWTVSSGPAGTSFSDATSPTATVSGMIPGGIYQFTWTITGSPLCASKSDVVKIQVDKSPIGGTTSTDAIVCSGGNSGTITLASQFGTVVRWESSTTIPATPASWVPIANTSNTQSYLNLTQTTIYRAVLHNGVCPDVTSAPTTITVLPLTVVSNAGPDAEVCASTTYTLQGNNPAPGTGKWTVTGGPAGVTFSDATNPNAVVSGLIPGGGAYQFTWTITSSSTCPPNSNSVNITIDKSPIGGTTSSPATVCTGSNSGTITLASQFGTVVRWESSTTIPATPASWVPIANTGTTQPYLNLTQTTIYRAVLHNGVCPDVTSAPTTITVQPLPVTSKPGLDAEICASTTYTLQGNNPSPGTGLWTVVSGPAGSSFSNATSPTATVSGLIPGNIYQFQWTITGSPSCSPSSNVVNITVDKSPIGGTTSAPATVCIGANSGQVVLASQFGTVTRWESSINNGANWLPIANTSTIQPYLNITQTTQYRAFVHNGVCPDVPSAPTTITVVPLPVTSSAGSNDEVCSVTSYTLHGNNPAPGTGKWTVTGPAGVTFSDATNPNAIANGLIPGIYQFTWTITGSPACPSNSNTVTITIDKAPVGGTTSSDATVCISGNAGQIALSGQFGTIVRWESSTTIPATPASWVPIANTSSTLSYLNLTQTTQYRAILHNSSTCADVPSSVTTITVAPLPSPAIAGTNNEVCNVTSYALQGNNPASGTGKWTVNGPAGVTFSDATNPNAIANGLIPGSIYQFTWTITTSPSCPSTSSTVTITIDKAPVAGIITANPAEVCFGSNGGTLTLTGQFGTIFRWESSVDNGKTWQAISNGTAIQTFTNLSQTTEYRAVLHNSNTCPDAFTAPTIVTVDPLPVASNPGPNDEVCNVTTYNLNGNSPSPGTGKWTITQGPAGATFSDDTNPNPIVSGLIPGNVYQFKWTITSSSTSVCPPNSNTVNITIDQAPIGGTTSSPAEVCATGNGGQIKLTGQLGTVVRWESSVSGGSWLPISNTGTTQSYLNLTQTTSYRAVVHNGATCDDVNSTVTTITVDPPPVDADAGTDDEVCSVTSYKLNGNSPAPGTGKWTMITGPAAVTFSDATDPAATVSGLIPGNVYQFRWSITGSAFCAPSTDIITIKIDRVPIGGTTSAPAEVCSGSNGGQIKLSGQFGNIVRWESSTTFPATAASWLPIANTSSTQSYQNLTQTTQYRAVLHNSTTCDDVTSTATTITVDPPPTTANAGTDDEVCSVTSYKLNGNNPAPGTGKWTVVTAPAAVTFSDATDPAATVSGLIPGNVYQFRWTITGSAFCSPSTDMVTITIDKAPIGGTTSAPAEVCSGANGGQIKLSGQFGSILRWESQVAGGSWLPIANNSTTQSYQNLTQTTQYRAVLHNGNICDDVTSTATTITVDTPPTTAIAGTDDEVCSVTSYKLNGNSPVPGTGKWTVVTGPVGATFSDATDPAATVSGLIPGNVYQFGWTITGSAFCPPSTDIVTVTVDKAPIGGTTSAPAEVCSGSNSGRITLAGQFGTIARWESSVNGGPWQPIANNITTLLYLNLTQTTQYRAVLHNGNVCDDVTSTATTITVDPPPTTAVAGTDDEVCSVTSYKLNGNSPAPGTGNWTEVTGPVGATFSDATDPAATVSGLIPGNVYQFKWSITGSAFCPPSTDIVTITIDSAPIGGTTSAPAEVCSGSNSGKITLAGQFGTIVRWESSTTIPATPASWVPIANTSNTQSYLNLTQTTAYRAVLHNGNVCDDVTSTATTITVDTPPTIADAGAGDEVCNVTTYTLHGNTPAYGTGLWTIVTGPPGVVLSDATNPSAILTGLIPGNVYQFKWTITGAATCPPSSSIVTIAIDQPPVGGTTSGPAEVCAGSNGGQIKLTGQFGNILRWESQVAGGPWQPIANTNNTQSYVNLTQTTQYRAVLHNSATCPDVTSTATTITVDPPPIAAVAGVDAEVCNVTTYTLNGNSPGTGTGQWTIVGGPAGATFLDATKPNAIVSGLIPGNVYQFQWSITGTAVCPPSTDIVTITIDKAPIGGTTSTPAEVCSGSNSGLITLSGQFGTVVRWESQAIGGQWQPIANTNITQPYLNLTKTTSYRAILHNSTTCADAASTPTTITVDPLPVAADAGVDAEVCSVTTYTLNGNSPAVGTGKWSIVGGPAGVTFSDVTNPAAIVSGLIPGSVYQFQWSITGTAACPPSTDIVTITIDKMPIGGTTSSPAEVCYGGNAGQIKLNGQFGSVVRWEFSIDNGRSWQDIANTGTTQPYINLIHTTQYRAMLHNSATCDDVASTATTITVDPPPIDADAGPDDEVCSVTSYNLHGNNPAPGTGTWTVVSGPTGATFSDATNPLATVSGLIPGNVYQFEWAITGTATCPPSTDIATIKVDKAPIGGTTSSPAEVCSGNNSGQITLSGQFGTIVRWEFSIDNSTWQPIANTSITQHFADLTQTTQFRAVLQNGAVCDYATSTATTITVDPPPVTSIPGPDDVVCSVTSYTLHANNPAPGTGKWTVVQGPAGATFSDDTNPNATVSGLIPGSIYQFKWVITNTAACPPSSGVVTITIDQAPLGGTTSGAATVCWGSNSGQILLTGQFGTIVRWESSIDNGASWQPIANSTNTQSYSNLTRTTQYRAFLHNGTSCKDVPSAPTIITVNPPTPIAQAGQDFNVCNQTAITLTGNDPGAFSGTWTQTAGPAVNIVDPSNYSTQVTGLSGDNIYTFQWTIYGLPPCANTSSSINIGLHTDVVPSFTMNTSHGCGPTVVTFTNTSTPAPVGLFVWNFGDGTSTITAINPPPHTFQPSSDGTEKTYTITMTPASNCGSQAPFVDKITVSPQTPVAAILPVQANACGTFTVTARNLSPGNNVKYDFYLLDENNAIVQHLSYPDNEDAVFQPIVPTQPTVYTVYMIATDQCGNQSRTVPVNIPASPSLVVSGVQIKGGVNSVCLGSPVTFQNISTGGEKATIIVYDSNKNPIATIPGGTADTEYIPPATGIYYVSLTAGNEGCGDAPVSALKEFTVYPVPKPSFTYTIDDQYNVTFTNTTPNAENIPASSLLYSWDFGDGSVKENAYVPSLHHFDFTKSPFTVALTATTPGTTCAGITTQVIEIKFHGNLFLPNAFIPSSSKKDLKVFMAKGFGLKTWHMQIFNNFGQMIWESTKLDSNGSPVEGWDGTYKGVLVEQGVYVWQISATLLNGQEWKGMSFGKEAPRAVGVIHLLK